MEKRKALLWKIGLKEKLLGTYDLLLALYALFIGAIFISYGYGWDIDQVVYTNKISGGLIEL